MIYNSNSEQPDRFYRAVDRFAQQSAKEAGTGLCDSMIPEYRDEFLSYYEWYELARAERAFDSWFRLCWDYYHYCIDT